MTLSTAATSFEERVATVLIEAGFLTAEQLEEARAASEGKQAGLLDTLLTLGIVGPW